MIRNLVKKSYREVKTSKIFISFLALIFLLSAFYPSDINFFANRQKDESLVVHIVENYVRFINAAAQVLIPIILQDKIGMMQAAYVGATTFIVTRVLKKSFNHFSVSGVPLGQRPNGGQDNMPSGHSSITSSAMYFVCRRYGAKHAIYLVPIMILTMYARVMLKAHTVSAVIAGCVLGIIVAALLTSKYKNSSLTK